MSTWQTKNLRLLKCHNCVDLFGFLIEIKKVWKSASCNPVCVREREGGRERDLNMLTAGVLEDIKRKIDFKHRKGADNDKHISSSACFLLWVYSFRYVYTTHVFHTLLACTQASAHTHAQTACTRQAHSRSHSRVRALTRQWQATPRPIAASEFQSTLSDYLQHDFRRQGKLSYFSFCRQYWLDFFKLFF